MMSKKSLYSILLLQELELLNATDVLPGRNYFDRDMPPASIGELMPAARSRTLRSIGDEYRGKLNHELSSDSDEVPRKLIGSLPQNRADSLIHPLMPLGGKVPLRSMPTHYMRRKDSPPKIRAGVDSIAPPTLPTIARSLGDTTELATGKLTISIPSVDSNANRFSVSSTDSLSSMEFPRQFVPRPTAVNQHTVEARYIMDAMSDPGTLISLLPMPRDIDLNDIRTDHVVSWPSDLVDALSPRIRILYDNQLFEDQELWFTAPHYMYEEEVFLDGTRYSLDRLLARKRDVMIFTTNLRVREKETIIKYQLDCGLGSEHPLLEDDVVHSLMRDFWFQMKVQDLDICPEVFNLSPPSEVPQFRTPKYNFKISLDELHDCWANRYSSVRYMLMEKISGTADHLIFREKEVTAWQRFNEGLDILLSLIPKLEAMHDRGIIHGDVHPGNVALLGGTKNYGFLDFGRAFLAEEYDNKPQRSGFLKQGYRIHCYVSYYFIEGYRYGYRDDMLNLLMVGSFVMGGSPLFDLCTSLRNNANGLHMFYRNFNTFAYNSLVDRAIPFLLQKEKESITDMLHLALVHARSVWDVEARPRYSVIYDLISSIKKRVQLGRRAGADPELKKATLAASDLLNRIQPKLPEWNVEWNRKTRRLITEAFTRSNISPRRQQLPRCVMPSRFLTLSDYSITYMNEYCGYELLEGVSSTPMCYSSQVSFHLASDFELMLRLIYGETSVFSRVKIINYDSQSSECGDHVVFTRLPIEKLNVFGVITPTPKLVASIASSTLRLVETIHSWGAVVGNERMLNYITLDKTYTQVRLRTVPSTFEMFVDPLTGRHVMGCSESYTDACFSRQKDLMIVDEFFELLSSMVAPYDARVMTAFNEFSDYVTSIQSNVISNPLYSHWISVFNQISETL
jgi:hypothetical protein